MFHGQEILDGKESDENVENFDLYLDEYSRSKRVAEDLVLQANGKQTLKTIVLRYPTKRLATPELHNPWISVSKQHRNSLNAEDFGALKTDTTYFV